MKGARSSRPRDCTIVTDVDDHRNPRTLALSLVASAALNLLIWILVIALAGARLNVPSLKNPQQREFIVSSSSIRIEKRAVPQPQRRIVPPQPPQPPQPQQRAARPQHAAAPPHELARALPFATPQPRPQRSPSAQTSLQAQLAQQEREFAKETQRLREEQAPLSIATIAPQPPSAIERSAFDASGRRARESVEAVLMPIPGKHWIAGGMSCYYVHYYANYSTGGSEDGNIPWPVCYPAAHDAMIPLDRPHELPIPSPPLGYVLPPGTALGPLLSAIYNGTVRQQ